MKDIKEQIAEIINNSTYQKESKLGLCSQVLLCSFEDLADKILSNVAIEIECPECNGLTYNDPHDSDNYCSKCKGTGKIPITLKEVVWRTKK